MSRGDEGNPARRVSGEIFLEGGDYFDGDYLSADVNLVARFSEHLRGALGVTRNDIQLPSRAAGELGLGAPARPDADFVTEILSGRVSYTATTRIYVDALVQYNTEIDDVTTNLRFNWKYRPGSDIYVVFNERRDTEDDPSGVIDRSFTVKWTYLLAL